MTRRGFLANAVATTAAVGLGGVHRLLEPAATVAQPQPEPEAAAVFNGTTWDRLPTKLRKPLDKDAGQA